MNEGMSDRGRAMPEPREGLDRSSWVERSVAALRGAGPVVLGAYGASNPCAGFRECVYDRGLLSRNLSPTCEGILAQSHISCAA